MKHAERFRTPDASSEITMERVKESLHGLHPEFLKSVGPEPSFKVERTGEITYKILFQSGDHFSLHTDALFLERALSSPGVKEDPILTRHDLVIALEERDRDFRYQYRYPNILRSLKLEQGPLRFSPLVKGIYRVYLQDGQSIVVGLKYCTQMEQWKVKAEEEVRSFNSQIEKPTTSQPGGLVDTAPTLPTEGTQYINSTSPLESYSDTSEALPKKRYDELKLNYPLFMVGDTGHLTPVSKDTRQEILQAESMPKGNREASKSIKLDTEVLPKSTSSSVVFKGTLSGKRVIVS